MMTMSGGHTSSTDAGFLSTSVVKLPAQVRSKQSMVGNQTGQVHVEAEVYAAAVRAPLVFHPCMDTSCQEAQGQYSLSYEHLCPTYACNESSPLRSGT